MSEEQSRLQQGPKKGRMAKSGPYITKKKKEKEGKIKITIVGEDGKMLDQPIFEKFSKGGRAGYKMGSKCKIATKGKGRAYGKNS
jgi:hypothetical protein